MNESMELRDRPVLLFAGDVMWRGVWGTQQHLAVSLSRHFRILFCDMPVSMASPLRDRSRMAQLRRRSEGVSDSLQVVSPIGIPPQDHPRMRDVNGRLMARQVVAALLRLGWPQPAVVIAGHTYTWRLRRNFHRAILCALLCDAPATADSDAAPERTRLLQEADCVVATSPVLTSEGESYGIPALYLPQGVDVASIETAAARPEPADLAQIARPRVGYVGTLTSRINDRLIERIAKARSDWQFVFLGSRRRTHYEVGALGFEGLPNVHMLGEKPRSDLGAYLARFDVGWVPYDWSPFNRASNPLKVMEYLAAGLPTVANRYAALADMGDLVFLVDEDESMLTALDAAAASQSSKDAAALCLARIDYARQNDWSTRGDALAAFLVRACDEIRRSVVGEQFGIEGKARRRRRT